MTTVWVASGWRMKVRDALLPLIRGFIPDAADAEHIAIEAAFSVQRAIVEKCNAQEWIETGEVTFEDRVSGQALCCPRCRSSYIHGAYADTADGAGFSCEGCGDGITLLMEFSKGQTMVSWRYRPETEETLTEIYDGVSEGVSHG